MPSVCVIGLGYVGFPLAELCARKGYIVYALENDPQKIERIQNERPDFQLNHPDALKAETVVICVPTPVDDAKLPDLTSVKTVTELVAKELDTSGRLIVLESTVNPFVSRNVMLPILEKNGYTEGKDFFLAHCPERINPGDAVWNVSNIPRVVGALHPKGLEKARAFYTNVLDAEVLPLSTIEAAEMVKIYENSLRAVNIAFANEMAIIMQHMKIDAKEVIDAVKTKPFGLGMCSPGPGVGGHCFHKNQKLFFVKEGMFSTATVEEVYDNFASGKWKSLDVLSFDLETKKMCYRPVTHTSKRFSEKIYTIRTFGGYKLRVTNMHPVIIAKGGAFHIKFARDLVPGERLVLADSLPEVGFPKTINIIPYLHKEMISKVRVRLKEGTFRVYQNVLRQHIPSLRLGDSYLREDYLPLEQYLLVERILGIPRTNILLVTGRGPCARTCPPVIEVNEDLARLVGYYLSEGCITVDKSFRIRFTFNSNEEFYLSDVKSIFHSMGIRYSVYQSKVDKAVTLKVSSELFGIFFRDILKTGVDCYTMQVPFFLMAQEFRAPLLAGLLRGDGGVFYENRLKTYRKNSKVCTHRTNSFTASYFTSSAILFQQMVLLLLSFGIVPSLQKRKGLLNIGGRKNAEQLVPLFADTKGDKLVRYLANQKKNIVYRNIQQHEGHYSAEIEAVEETSYHDFVYSLEVDQTHTLVVDGGVIAHNCIPVDPFYLIQESQRFGFEPSFLRTAMRVNSFMPEYTVSLLMHAMNDAGKPVRGSKIGILGVSYKRDVGDIRESPALDVIKRLKKLGADLKIHDPYVPSHSNATAEDVMACDAVVLLTDHTPFHALDFSYVPVVVDGRNMLDPKKLTGVYKGIGR